MKSRHKKAVADLILQLKQERDELKLKMHLGKEDLTDEWNALQDKLAALSRRYKPLRDAIEETSDEVWDSLKLVGGEIRTGFDRIRRSL